ncbi:hypothetical protein Salat_1419300 [Sesamum alatum]|uniref:Uncharacterized protein n=1 Tax=Sesamum alatum TaxID=300844 RepID=A0AAE1YAQ0_9LAMI|nr:hypothetical protein Salat_1419300 [Sesamum alatum]
MPELAPRQLGIHRPFTVPKRCTKKVKANDVGPDAPSEDAPLDDHPNDIVDTSGTGLNDTLDLDGPDVQNDEPYAPPEMRPSMIIPMSLSILLSTKTFNEAFWLLESFIFERIPRASKNRYLDEEHSKQILSGVTVEDLEWRPYERLHQEQSQMLSLEPQRIFFTTSVLFYYQLINYDMPELAPRQLGIHRPFTVPKRCTKKDAPLDEHPNDIVDPSGTGLNDTLDFDGLDVQNDKPYAPVEMRPSMIIPMSLSILLILIVHTIQKIILVLAVLDHKIILIILHQLCEDKRGKDIRLRVGALPGKSLTEKAKDGMIGSILKEHGCTLRLGSSGIF